MVRLFISQPMGGKSEEEILRVRKHAVEAAERILGEKVEVIDSFIKGAPEGVNDIWYLGESIKLLSAANVVYFVPGWKSARGCRCEYEIAREYHVPVIGE